MPNTKSAIKRNRVQKRKALRNKLVTSTLKTVCKKATVSLEGKNKEEAKEAIGLASSKLDKAATKGIIHKNKAARKKSRLMKKLNSME